MAWFKVDDGFHASRKLMAIPKRARFGAAGLWVVAGSWVASELTDGHVPDYMILEFGCPPSAPDALVDAGLWDRVSGGYLFCNWHEYQPSKRDVEADREASKTRMRELREKRKREKAQKQRDSGEVFGGTFPNGVEGVRDPDPTRPDPTLLSTNTPIDPPAEENKKQSKKKNKTTIPEGWIPNQNHTNYANDHSLNLQTESMRFRNWALANNRQFVDWDAAFRNWLIKALEYGRTTGPKVLSAAEVKQW